MFVENTKENRELKAVADTMAIENMYISSEFLQELLKVEKGEKTAEELRQEVIQKYAR